MIRQFWIAVVKELRQRNISLATYCLISFLIIWMYVALFPTFQEQSEQFSQLFEIYPDALKSAFGLDEMTFGSVEGFVAAEHFSFIWQILAIIVAASFAGTAIAGEIEKGTIGLSLSLPMQRWKIYLAKYKAAGIAILTFGAISVLSLIPLPAAHNLEVSELSVLKTFVLCLGFLWAVTGFSFAVSSFAKEKSTTYFLVGGVTIIMYILNTVASLVDKLDWLKWGSIFHYFAPGQALTRGRFELDELLVLIGLALFFSVIGLWQFNRRDISI